MRLEQLFKQLDHFLKGTTVYDNRAVIAVLLDILMIFNRNDLKAEVLKELKRHAKLLGYLTTNDGIDSKKLTTILDNVNVMSEKLYQASGRIGRSIMESDLFKSISQRSSIPGGMCSFDLPEFHYWLEQDTEAQQYDLQLWTEPFDDIGQALSLILNFIRESSNSTQEVAESGFFQLTLEQSRPYQLLRISVDQSLPCFAEISGGKHRFTVRFMKKSSGEIRATQVSDDIPFSLTRCAF